MNAVRKKLRDRRGISMTLALFVMLIAVMISIVILRAATTNAGRIRSGEAEEQAYLTVSSAALLLRDSLFDVSLSWAETDAPSTFTGTDESPTLVPLLMDMAEEIRDGSIKSERTLRVETERNMGDVTVLLRLSSTWALRGDLCLAGSDLTINHYLALSAPGMFVVDVDGNTTLTFPSVTIGKGGTR